MPTPSLPNYGYGLALDPSDMMERVFGPTKRQRGDAMVRDTQFAAEQSRRDKETEYKSGTDLLTVAASLPPVSDGQGGFMPDPRSEQLMQEGLRRLGITSLDGGGGGQQAPGLPQEVLDAMGGQTNESSGSLSGVLGAINQMFTNPNAPEVPQTSGRGGFEQIGNALVPDAVRQWLGVPGRGQPPARPQSVGEQSLAAQPLPQAPFQSLTQPPQTGGAEQLLQTVGSEQQQQPQNILQKLLEEVMRQTQGQPTMRRSGF